MFYLITEDETQIFYINSNQAKNLCNSAKSPKVYTSTLYKKNYDYYFLGSKRVQINYRVSPIQSSISEKHTWHTVMSDCVYAITCSFTLQNQLFILSRNMDKKSNWPSTTTMQSRPCLLYTSADYMHLIRHKVDMVTYSC